MHYVCQPKLYSTPYLQYILYIDRTCVGAAVFFFYYYKKKYLDQKYGHFLTVLVLSDWSTCCSTVWIPSCWIEPTERCGYPVWRGSLVVLFCAGGADKAQTRPILYNRESWKADNSLATVLLLRWQSRLEPCVWHVGLLCSLCSIECHSNSTKSQQAICLVMN